MITRKKRHTKMILLTACAALATLPATAHAQTSQQAGFDIPAQDLGTALTDLARQSNREIYFSADLTRGKRAPQLRGRMSVEKALQRLLAHSGLHYRLNTNGSIVVETQVGNGSDDARNSQRRGGSSPSVGDASAPPGSGQADPTGSPADILVTGSRIKGAITASPRVTITAAQIKEEGQTDLGQVIRDIPQNFSGGQNPGVLSSASGTNNQNQGGGSALDLRGLGPGATLTLLNGKRMSYSGTGNAIDVSSIPLAAVDRIDIITDGASAIYGSDAVAGVANIILRRDYNGLTAALRGGTATRGGGTEYQLSLTGGTTWQSGGFVIAYDRGHADAVLAHDRTYVIGQDDPTTLYPELGHDSLLFSGHQRLGSAVILSLDGLYTLHTDDGVLAAYGDLYRDHVSTHAFSISPALDVDLSGGWTARLTGTYGNDKQYDTSRVIDASTQAVLSGQTACYCNKSLITEVGVEGPLFELPGGAVRIAAGGGYRRNTYLFDRTTISGSQKVYGGADASSYAYGEVNLPLVSPTMNVAAIHRLSLSAAVRYEKYLRLSGTATPKIGLVYEPTADFSLKGSWGRSFKAATLTQEFQPGYAELEFARNIGGTGYPASATAIVAYGPNPNLLPERAESWTATFGIHPEKIAGLNLEISYFTVAYTDRILSPVNNFFAALSEPAYAPFVLRAPTAAQIGTVLSASSTFYNDAGSDPYAAVAIVNSTLANVSSDHVSGADVSGSYRFALGGGNLTFRGSGSWLRGHRELLKGTPTLQTAGVVFNPPGFHGRAGVTWDKGGLSVAAFVNHLDGVFANYYVVQNGNTGSFDTVDLNLRYGMSEGHGFLSGLEFTLTADNALDAKPPLFKVSYAGLPNYDSTNYSSIGRTISFTVTKKW